MAALAQRWVARIAAEGGAERRLALGHLRRDLVIAAEAAVVLVVVFLGDDAAVGELALEVERVGSALAGQKGAEDRVPVGAVGMDAPQAPEDAAAQALRLQR